MCSMTKDVDSVPGAAGEPSNKKLRLEKDFCEHKGHFFIRKSLMFTIFGVKQLGSRSAFE